MVARFEERLSAQVAVAFFIPAIVYLADAVGTQTEAMVVRGLSFERAAPRPPARRRARGGRDRRRRPRHPHAGAGCTWCFGDAALSLAVALSVLVASSTASACGLIFPWLLWRAGLDPAFGSGPLATVVQDVLSLLVYFAVVQLIVPV